VLSFGASQGHADGHRALNAEKSPLRLTKLELHGFKSFADFTSLTFSQGVTAIVGPNGCGKSNVSDAVRWVLGEQRARLLRGAKMDEVIFQGSSARRAVNIAEVSLHFENEDGGLPIAFREVVITRRLSRSGESDYLLNGAPCRLRDISDLLRGTGLGADTGVVIESKMIDALLSDRPDDRRELFEEAAGVGLYRDRRRTTERRLEETTADLQRLDDLISEVTTQLRSLSRQRRRAERHSELTGRRFTVEIALAAREMDAWRDELARLEPRVGELRTELPGAEAAVEAAEASRDFAHAARAAAEAERAELSRMVAQQRDQAQEIRGEVAVAEERQRNAAHRRQRAEAEASQGQLQGARIGEHRDHATHERQALDQALEAFEAQLSERQREEDASRDAVSNARTAADAAERTLRDVQDRARHVAMDHERVQRELDDATARTPTLDAERLELADSLATARRDHERGIGALAEAQARAVTAAAELDEARQADRVTRDQDAEARGEFARLDETATALQARSHALEGLERERVGLAPSTARLLHDREQFEEGAVLGPLSDFLSTDPASARLVERFLGATAHAVLVRDRAAAESVRRWHERVNPGPLLLLPLDAVPVSAPGSGGPDTPGISVEARAPASAWVSALLGRVQPLDGGVAFVDARGAVWLPGAEGGPGPVRRRAEMASLRLELETVEGARKAAMVRATTARQALLHAEKRAADALDASVVAQHMYRESAEHHATVERRAVHAARDLDDAAQLSTQLARRCAELRDHLVTHKAEADSLGFQLEERQAVLAAARARLAEAELGLERARDQRTACQVEQARLHARMQVASDREERLSDELRSASERVAALHAELNALAREDAAVAEQLAMWRADLSVRAATLADGEGRLGLAERTAVEAGEMQMRAEHALDEARHAAARLAESVHHAELRLADLSGRRRAIRERLEAEWRRPLEDMLGTAQALDADDEALQAEAASLREQIEGLGPVNVLAIEEHDEVARRVEFLTAQRIDLGDARNALQQAIREIDVTAREMFLKTFVHIRDNFHHIFLTLFGGGECDLRLENPEAPLDCDIEIHASPRGKRTQRIHLLSSGERALVALSLLFGIFLTKPSPFCLLDEVDAPLDDANIGRFVRMLTEFKARTQFIVITHNPRTTTEAADAVYGVTMQEPGVSSLVSVRLRGAPVDTVSPSEVVEALTTA
jgi:chromosome segregation protein